MVLMVLMVLMILMVLMMVLMVLMVPMVPIILDCPLVDEPQQSAISFPYILCCFHLRLYVFISHILLVVHHYTGGWDTMVLFDRVERC